MATLDPKGYYARLSVSPHASHADITTAYRMRAMELHPDRNPGRDTTSAFQELQAAYAIVGDPSERAKYDSLARKADAAESKPFEPIYCSRCGSISALPRYRVFHSVIGYITGATKRPHQGIYCARCETLVAVKATALTTAFGWWSIHGFFWSLKSIAMNLIGGQPYHEQNARVLGYQAMYFASTGKTTLARAVAEQALSHAFAAGKVRSGETRKGIPDPLKDMKHALHTFLASFAEHDTSPSLRGTSRLWNSRFGAQCAVIAVALSALVIIVYTADQRSIAAQQMASEAERLRLERVGLERATALAIANNEAAELRKHEEPTPLSGLYWSLAPIASENMPPFKITSHPGANYFIKLLDWNSNNFVLSIFVRGGETVELAIPPGTYRLNMASGSTWYGEDMRFGPETDYSSADQPFTFAIEGLRLSGNEITLYNVPNGNIHRKQISASQF